MIGHRRRVRSRRATDHRIGHRDDHLDATAHERRTVASMSFRYAGYDESRSIPNIVVDGAANEATVLTLSHWPGAPTPAELARDLSAEIAFAYLDAPCDHPPAEVVTNNHFDADGRVGIVEHPEIDLAVVRIDPREPTRWGNVVGSCEYSALHPMALHNATGRFRILVIHGRRYRYVDRYETWVQYVSRPTLPRVDMAPLAAELTSLEQGDVTWTAGPPSGLTPTLAPDDESTIDADVVVALVERFLRAAASGQQ